MTKEPRRNSTLNILDGLQADFKVQNKEDGYQGQVIGFSEKLDNKLDSMKFRRLGKNGINVLSL